MPMLVAQANEIAIPKPVHHAAGSSLEAVIPGFGRTATAPPTWKSHVYRIYRRNTTQPLVASAVRKADILHFGLQA